MGRRPFRLERLPFRALQVLHSGIGGDYTAGMMPGIAAPAIVMGG